VKAPKVAGLDLSLQTAGIATPDGRSVVLDTVDLRGVHRLAFIEAEVLTTCDGADLVVIENYAYAAPYGAHQLGELGGVVRLALWRAGFVTYLLAPAKLKKYATGKGKAGKPEVVACARERFGYGGMSPDGADAWIARAFGMALLGHSLVELPKDHLLALRGVELVKADR
jgi:crossover junction endodeoxyribonuclease RuvC